jgi:hypothetical protein
VRTIIPVLALALAAGGISQTVSPAAAMRDLSLLVPRGAEIPGWTARGEAQRFAGDDLFVYIDGGAEIYNEYGFRQVLAQDFVDKNRKGVTLEIYEMTDPAAAYGIFSFKASGKGRPAGIGEDSEFEDYYLHFRKGPFLVTVTGFEANPDCRDGVAAIARATGARIKETAGQPAFLSKLPGDWIKPGLKYLRGGLGLFNLHPALARNVKKFGEAAVVPIEEGRVFVFGYPSAAEARARLEETRRALAADSAFRNVREFPDGHFEAAETGGNAVYARVSGAVVGLVLSPRASAVGADLLNRLRE